MKMIVAIIQPYKLDDVREAITKLGVSGMTVTEVKGMGRQKGLTERYRGTEILFNFRSKLKMEVAVSDDMLDKCFDAIMTAARTGKVGDGKIFVYDLQRAVRIRTGEADEAINN